MSPKGLARAGVESLADTVSLRLAPCYMLHSTAGVWLPFVARLVAKSQYVMQLHGITDRVSTPKATLARVQTYFTCKLFLLIFFRQLVKLVRNIVNAAATSFPLFTLSE